jgi:DNA-binding NtrC family response regulator
MADDDRKIIDMLRRTLAYEGYQVMAAAEGREAPALRARVWSYSTGSCPGWTGSKLQSICV